MIEDKGDCDMAKVFIFQTIELNPGVKGEDFEKFFLEEYAPLGPKIGWYPSLLKADRGERTGKYAAIWEIESVAARNRISSAHGSFTEDALRLLGPEFEQLNEKYNTYVAQINGSHYIDLGR
jgi:hypothetical protein